MKHVSRFCQALRCLGLLLVLLPFTLRAQQTGSVTGALLDKSSGQPLPFATVVLLRAQDSSFVQGTQTAENGTFAFSKATLGSYLLRASVLGYQPLRKAISLTAAAPNAQLGPLRLAATATQLAGVTVQGERAAVVESLDKKVINVEKDLSSVGGTAVNVLQNVPSVSVDQNGTVSMRGSTNITVLVDGKPSGAANGGTGTRLDQIPASAIEKVEVVTNPSARYDAAGAGGVINIILKKQRKDGWNGQATANLGSRDKYNTSLSLNRRTGKLNVFGSYDMRDDRYRSTNDVRQNTVLAGKPLFIGQDGRALRHNTNHGGRLGFDYTFSPEQSLTLTAEPNSSRGLNLANQQATLRAETGTEQQQNRLRVSEDVQNVDVSADYRRTWAAHKGRELTANAGYTRLWADVVVGQQLTTETAVQPEWQQVFRVRLHAPYGQLDYTHPFDSLSRLDVGLKGQWQQNNGTDDFLLLQNPEQPTRLSDRSFAYDFTEYLQAGYATYQRQLGPWSYQGGLRAEYTHTYGEVLGRQGRFDLRYLNLFPSATVARTLPHDQKVQLSYARRLNRPGFMQLLAFPLYQDPRYYRLGNPALRPEYINAFELGHQVSVGRASVSSTLFYRQTTNAIQRIREVDEEATRQNGAGGVVTVEKSVNLGQSTSYGAELSVNQPVAKWWRVAASGSLFRNRITAATGTEASRRNLTGTARLQNTFNPTPKLDVQLTGTYRAAVITPQGRLAPQGGLDVALRQRLFQERGALTLRVSDIFDTQRQRITAFGPGLEATYLNKYETRVAYLGFTWYFGLNKPPKKIESAPQGGGGGFGG
ncbi:Outer membrane receptor for ferrienterochelin and colicins [Hymenobacter daecheongensis DSM 21074]|uniref:Outer membrane receptor for ferrienterochelin and colicins n=1 Tax=Hymenobacter daecheongensis DSM 21074 TaxID=1121955 RepID=A0A1M6EEZ4_9BACT|nr:TonB-dependent receptor [Hymenobacter daecheongensis]SHI83868.1 Outer membrane receptor for ferrienterochelin and colicins [Hymenobacter daecheongensis DSM 21074]